MKIKFTVKEGKLLSSKSNNEVLKDYIISEEGLQTSEYIAKYQNQKVFDLLSHKILYISLPVEYDGEYMYVTVSAFLVRTKDGVKVWSDHYFEIEDGDMIFTDAREADEYSEKKNKYNEMCDFFEFLFNDLVAVAKEIDNLEKEIK